MDCHTLIVLFICLFIGIEGTQNVKFAPRTSAKSRKKSGNELEERLRKRQLQPGAGPPPVSR